MREPFRLLSAPFVLASLVWCAPAPAQWASTPLAPSGEIVAADGWVAHRGDGAWRVFSAATRTWRDVATAEHDLVASGAHVALFADGGDLVAYDARGGAVARLSVAALLSVAAGADVIAVVASDAGATAVHAFGSQTARWSAQPIAAAQLAPSDVAVDEGVIVVQDGDAYHGYAARLGTWSSLQLEPGAGGGDPVALGEIALAYVPEPAGGGDDRMIGFSAVVGAFDVVADLHFSSSTLMGRHVALVRVQHPILTRFYPSAFSAYAGRWVTATKPHVPTRVVQYAGDSIAALENIAGPNNLHVFHAAPATWSLLAGGRVVLGVEGDALVAEDPSSGQLTAASGLVPGFAHADSVAPHGVASGSAHLALVANGEFQWRAYAPATGTWSEVVDGVEWANSTAVAGLVDAGGQARAFSARGTTWSTGPVLAPGSTTIADGSLLAWQDGASGALGVFDGRRATVVDGPLLTSPTVVANGRVIVAWSPLGDVWGYSARRGDWTAASHDPLAVPFGVAPTAHGDVAWFVDGAQRLWAFGTGRDVEPDQDWPDGSAVVAPDAAKTAGARLVVHGTPGELALLFASPALGTPLALTGFGGWMELDVAGAFLLGVAPIEAGGTWRLELPLADGLPVGLRVWLQSVAFDPVAGTWRFGAGAADLVAF